MHYALCIMHFFVGLLVAVAVFVALIACAAHDDVSEHLHQFLIDAIHQFIIVEEVHGAAEAAVDNGRHLTLGSIVEEALHAQQADEFGRAYLVVELLHSLVACFIRLVHVVVDVIAQSAFTGRIGRVGLLYLGGGREQTDVRLWRYAAVYDARGCLDGAASGNACHMCAVIGNRVDGAFSL